MFVSSYSTYIGINNSLKSENYKERDAKNTTELFSEILSNSTVLKPYTNLPIDYISNYKSLNNQQKLLRKITIRMLELN